MFFLWCLRPLVPIRPRQNRIGCKNHKYPKRENMVSCDDCLTSRPAEWVCCAPECGLNMCEEHAQKHRCVWYKRNMLLSLHNDTGVLTVGSAPFSSLCGVVDLDRSRKLTETHVLQSHSAPHDLSLREAPETRITRLERAVSSLSKARAQVDKTHEATKNQLRAHFDEVNSNFIFMQQVACFSAARKDDWCVRVS
jgi:hypothetical protein